MIWVIFGCASRVLQALPEAAGNGWQGSSRRQGTPAAERQVAMEPEGGQGKANLGDALLFRVLQQASLRPCSTLAQYRFELISVYKVIDMRPSIPVELSSLL